MTIASEISRLQCAKADIKTAIENKGVTVGSDLTIDGYACCIDEIQSGGSAAFGFIAVGGGGGGAHGSDSNACDLGGSGGGGEVLISNGTLLQGDIIDVEIGKGGDGRYCYQQCISNGGCTCLLLDGYTIVAKGGCAGINRVYECNCKGGGVSGGGHIPGSDYKCNTACYAAGGGAGAGGNGCNTVMSSTRGRSYGGNGGCGICGYGGGGGGSSHLGGGCGVDGGANGVSGTAAQGCNATNYGGGGSGGIGACCGGCGCQGIVKIWYPEDGSYGITEGGGGTVTKENGCVIHTFTESGAFFKEKPVKMAKVVIVGGGAGASCDGTGGGGGNVCIGYIQLSSCNTITIGCGGLFNEDGGDTCITGDGVNVVINGGKANGCSGSGCLPGCSTNCNYNRGGGAGACGNGTDGRYESYTYYGGNGGCGTPFCCGGYYGYGGGGYGYYYGGSSNGGGGGYGYCNGGQSACQCYRNACRYGGGGGGGCPGVTSGAYMGGNGCQGIVMICYPTGGSYGICCATGGTVTTEGSYTVHTFTSNGTFTIVS